MWGAGLVGGFDDFLHWCAIGCKVKKVVTKTK